MVQKRRHGLWAKWKSVLWSDESKFDILVVNHGCRVLQAKEERDLPACHQCSAQKPASMMVWGCRSAYGMGSLYVLEGTMNAERFNIKVLEQYMLPSRLHLFQQDNAKPHTAAITTAWLHSRRVRVLNWPACSPDLSPIENIWCILKWKICQRWPQTLQQVETYIRQEWDQIPTPKLINPDAQMSSNCFKKKRICCTMVNMPPSQLFWDLYQATNLKLAHFVLKILNISQFKHLLCYLCFIVNKILAHVIRKYFSDHFIQIKKTATTFLEFGLQYHRYFNSHKTTLVFCEYFFAYHTPRSV